MWKLITLGLISYLFGLIVNFLIDKGEKLKSSQEIPEEIQPLIKGILNGSIKFYTSYASLMSDYKSFYFYVNDDCEDSSGNKFPINLGYYMFWEKRMLSFKFKEYILNFENIDFKYKFSQIKPLHELAMKYLETLDMPSDKEIFIKKLKHITEK